MSQQRSSLDDAVDKFFEFSKTHSAQDIGALIVEVLLEAQHNSWDGMLTKDKAPIARFLNDLVTYGKGIQVFNPVIFTGSQYLTTDRPDRESVKGKAGEY